jgi:calcium-dependent protein kinase
MCQGGELFDQLTGNATNKKGFAESKAARMLQDMLSAVLYLHNNGIVHRDLKLENFLFEEKTPNSSLKLIDFGLSKHFAEHERMRQVRLPPYTQSTHISMRLMIMILLLFCD